MDSKTLIKKVGGTEVFLTPEGKFQAFINGDVVTRTTMAAIEKLCQGNFKPFEALNSEGKVRIVGIKKNRSRWGGSHLFVDDCGREYPRLYKYCPESVEGTEKLKALNDQESEARNAFNTLRDEIEKERRAILDSLPLLTASKYQIGDEN